MACPHLAPKVWADVEPLSGWVHGADAHDTVSNEALSLRYGVQCARW